MELVIIVSTITSFFSHYMIEKGVVANAVSVLLATLITWMLIGDPAADFDTIFMRNIVITAVLALVVSMIVGLVFAHHKKCTYPGIRRWAGSDELSLTELFHVQTTHLDCDTGRRFYLVCN